MPRGSKKVLKVNASELIDAEANLVSLQSRLRAASFNAISEDDVKQIVQKQVKLAKEGNVDSVRFLWKYSLGFGQPITFQQTNIMSADPRVIDIMSQQNPRIVGST